MLSAFWFLWVDPRNWNGHLIKCHWVSTKRFGKFAIALLGVVWAERVSKG